MLLFKEILTFLTGCGVFIVGISILSKGLLKACQSNERLRRSVRVKSVPAGVLSGLAYSGLTQSSSATTAFVVSLVDAGVISLIQASGLIMGANIGTTVTSFIVSLSSLDITPFLTIFAFIGAFFILSGSTKSKMIGEVLCGFGLLFVGIGFLDSSLENPEIEQLFVNFFKLFENPFLLILIGTIATAAVQSSSITSSISIIMVGSHLLSFSGALYLIIGANVGACITALLTANGRNISAKRAAMMHIVFNLFGCLIFTPLIICNEAWIEETINSSSLSQEFMVAVFHLVFNVVCTLILMPLAKPFVKLCKALVPEFKKKSPNNY